MDEDKKDCEHLKTEYDKFERELGEYYFDIEVTMCADCGKILYLGEF